MNLEKNRGNGIAEVAKWRRAHNYFTKILTTIPSQFQLF